MQRPMCVFAVLATMAMAAAGSAAAEDFIAARRSAWSCRRTSAAAMMPTGARSPRTCASTLRASRAIIVQNMPGGGGLLSANWLLNVAPKDGLTIGLIQRGVPFYPYFGDKNALFMPTQFNWLGSFNAETGSTTMWRTA